MVPRAGKGKMLGRARRLRRQASEAEHLLWRHLRDRRLNGWKFRRQVVLEPYIVDFYCHDAGLVIEADGGQHGETAAYDGLRTQFLKTRGIRVLRFWNNEILNELPSVLERIAAVLEEAPSPRPSPRGRGG